MDRKSIIILAACFLLLVLWVPLVNRVYPPVPAPKGTNTLAGLPRSASHETNAAAANTNTLAAVPAITMPSAPAAAWVRPEGPENLETIETAEARYTFTSHGGGLKLVELKKYPETVGRQPNGHGATNRLAALNWNAAVPVLAVMGGGVLQDGGPFALSRSGAVVRAEKLLTNGMRLVKEFRVGANHLVHAIMRFENPTTERLAVPPHEWNLGTATPMNRRDAGQFVGLQWYDGTRATYVDQSWFANATLGCGCLPGTPRRDYQSPGADNVVWGAAHNQFFTLIGVPQKAAPYLAAHQVDMPPPTPEERAADPKAVLKPVGYQVALGYPVQAVAPGQSLEQTLDLYAGPKEYNTLAGLGRNLDLAMNFSSFFGWFAKGLLLAMIGLSNWGLPYGLAIIFITIVIRLLFWPLTRASTRSMKRMQLLQPEMKALQAKYKDDPKKMNLKLMEFMKEKKVSPLGGCVPIVLQIPVFIGFYQMLQSAIELRGARFLWATDLSQPDTIAFLFGFPINPLPLLMGATQFWQARLTPVSPGMDPMQQKMMQYMPLILLVILYNFPAGLALYWTVQNLLGILQMKLTKAGTIAGPEPPTKPVRPWGRKK